jgi:alanyl-tRNA synthetase|tara:strand:+ start:48824 stop:50599 length:1776 start_codon:yes stop_codon:yes gene_type:complete
MESSVIRKRFLVFFEKRGHAVVPSASLVPTDDPSVLFTTAGMQPLVPFLMGEPHPKGKRIVNVQKCVRTQDIEEVGDKTHDTFFEMLGNWSLGDYFKEDAITWSYEFLISKDEGLGLDPKRLYITCFEGDEDAPRDIESFEIWKKVGIPENRIYFFGKKENWWSPGDNGPCGPDSEMFYDVTGTLGDIEKDGFIEADNKQQIVEIWNDVFMEYEKKDGKVIGKLKQQNVDTGAGLERLAMVMQDTDNVFDTDLFQPLMKTISEHSRASDVRAERIVADHIRTATFIIADGVTPSNTDRGYILRRLIRRAVRYADVLGIEAGTLPVLARTVIGQYKDVYGNFEQQEGVIVREIEDEEQKFRKTLDRGMKEFKKIAQNNISGADAFILFSTYGFPLELTVELALEKGISVDEEGFQAEMKKHQEQSRAGGEQKFKGGLADTSEMSVKYHTATHLLHQALRDVLGNHVQQKGSNITPERLRFDFSFDRKLSDEERKQVEDAVNERIEDSLSVSYEDVPLEEAKNRGAIGLFEEQYGDTVRVYKIGDPSTGSGQVYSLELCGGPHVKNTSELGHFTIKKEEAVAAGTRRIKAVLK